MGTYTLTGALVDKKTLEGIAELRVEAWAQISTVNRKLGKATTDAAGKFALKFTISNRALKRQPLGIIKVFSNAALLHTSTAQPIADWIEQQSDLVIELNIPSTPTIPDGIPELSDPTDNKEPVYRVSGHILQPAGRPAEDLTVVAFDRAVCEEKPLGVDKTEKDGSYQINYSPVNFTDPAKPQADLIVRVYKTEVVDEVPLVSSPLILGASEKEVINLSIGEDAFTGLTLYELAEQNLAGHVKGKFDCIDKTGIWYLVNKTGLSANVITQFINANTLSQQLGVKRNVTRTRMLLFALLRAGLVSDLSAFSQLSDKKIVRAMDRAVRDRWVPRVEYAPLLTGLRNLRVGISLTNDKDAEALMSLSRLSTEQMTTVYNALLVNKGDNNDVLNLLDGKSGFGADAVEQLKNTVDIYQFVGRNLDIVKQLIIQQKIQDPRSLVTLDETAWKAVLTPIARELPSSIPGKEADEKVAWLASKLTGLTEKKYPGEFFARRLLGDQETRKTPINRFLTQNPDFDFSTETVRQRLGEPSSPAEFKRLEQLQAAESLFHILPDNDRYGKFKLLNTEFVNSSALAATSKTNFRKTFADDLGSVAIADSIYSQSRHLQAKNAALNANQKILSATVASKNSTNSAAKSQTASSFPTMDALFGDVYAASCDHCQSATSPSAYLVDLLTYLQRASDDNGNDGLALLRGKLGAIEDFRRPDIELLELSCDNSDTPVPYIDLLLEVLENAVTNQMDNVHQTFQSEEEIAARPEHTNFAAYERVVDAVYPWNLPFNIDLQTSRAYLQQMGLSRYLLLDDLHSIEHTILAAGLATSEYLGLSPLQTIIVSTPADKVPTLTREEAISLYWGLLPSETIAELKNLEFILRKSGLDQETFEAVLAAEFVNPGGSVYIDANAEMNGADEEFLDRFHRFARLHIYSGLVIQDLDIAMTSLDSPQLKVSALIPNLACIFRVADESNLDVIDVTGWWTNTTQDSLSAFAVSLGEDSIDAERFAELSGIEPAEPLLAWQFWHAWQEFHQSGLVVSEVFELLKIPLDGETYSITASTDILLEIQAALNGAALTTADTTGIEIKLSVLPVEQKRLIIQDTIATACSVESALIATFFDDYSNMLPESQPEIYITLMGDDFSADEIEGSPAAEQFSVFWKQLFLAAMLELEASDFSDISTLVPSMKWMDPTALSVDSEQLTRDFVALSSLYFHQQLNLQRFTGATSLYRAMIEFGQYTITNGFDFAEFASQISAVSDWTKDDLLFLTSADGFAFKDGAEFLGTTGLLKIETAIAMAESHDLLQQQLWSFSDWKNVEDIREVLENKYESSQWLDISEQLHNPLREQQRDALLNYLIPRVSALFATNFDAYDVYAFYLIDPEMSSCFITSRTKQAISSVQQYIQRILLNLEGTLQFDDQDDIRQWEWRKNYRVWEANVKTFFFPENFLWPELRDDKSELFEVLEGQLLQDEVRSDTAQIALLEYCRGLHNIGNLEIAAIYQDEGSNDNGNTSELQVFSRTRAIPHDYYHCTRNENGLWSNWREVKVDIAGNHLIPVKYNGRMYLFWPVFEEKLDSVNEVYKEALAAAELAINDAKTQIDSNKKLIDDVSKLIVEFQDYDIDPYPLIVTSYETILENAVGLVEEYDQAYLDALQEKDKLIVRYTYLDTTLNWSEQLLTGSWSPKKVGESSLQTIVENGYVSNPEDVRLSIKSVSPQLEIRLYGKKPPLAAYIEFEAVDITLYSDFGSYLLDICENKMVANKLAADSEEIVLFQDAYFSEDSISSPKTDVRVNQKWLDSDVPSQLYFVPEPGQHVKIIDNELAGAKYYSISPIEAPAKDLSVFTYEDASRVFILDRRKQNSLDIKLKDEPILNHEYMPPNVASWEKSGSRDSLWESAKIVVTRVGSQPTESSVWDSYAPVAVSSDGYTQSSTPFGGMAFETKPTESLTDWGQSAASSNQSTAATSLNFSEIKYGFTALYHPYTCSYIRQLSHYGIDGLYNPDKELGGDSLKLYRQQVSHEYFAKDYNPTVNVDLEYPIDNIEFTHGTPYAVYNWELFYHAPMLIAKRLIQNQKFEEAQTWLHYIFNPTANDGNGGARYWRFRPFWLEQIEINNGDYTSVEQLAQFHSAEFDAQIAVWQENPFNPYAISRLRTIAFMRNTVMTYLDNLLAWGDQLFRRDSIESINEAAQIYLLAAEILGPQPLKLPASTELGQAGTALDYINGTLSVAGASSASGSGSNPSGATGLLGILLSFCIPANDTLLGYWDTVSDRLFKIRHCMNIEGVVRSLALFEPPIDPALLVKATASGLSIADAVSGLSAPRPHYRFNFMLQKTQEFLAEVKSLGGALLAALEKQDAEGLANIRASHEVSMAKKILDVRKEQVDEIEYSLSGLNESLFSVMHRRDHYQNLIDVGMLDQESDEQDKLKAAHGWEQAAAETEGLGAILSVFPQIVVGFPPSSQVGGIHFGNAASAIAKQFGVISKQFSFKAGKLAREASNIRRSQEWVLQLSTAERDVEKLNKDILALEVRKAIAEREVANQETQIANSQEAELFLLGKFTNEELYGWMVTQLSTLYFQTYQLAQELASAAEQCYQYELGVDASEASFIQFGHWDSLHKGLLVGEKLALDLRQMELSYLNKNKRRYELSKHVSMLQLSPEAWIQLRETGQCVLTIPEDLFDLDYPGHYKRRIKSVSLSIPAITGPYTNLSCTLTLLQDWTRPSADLTLDTETIEWNAVPQSIATSGAQNDTGMFQLDFRDERYLPFEGAGAISQWKLVLAKPSLAQFDYHSISDVIFHINYTAEEGAQGFKEAVELELEDNIDRLAVGRSVISDTEEGLFQLLSMKHHFSDIWAMMWNSNPTLEFSTIIDIKKEYFPYVFKGRSIEIFGFDFIAVPKTAGTVTFDSEVFEQMTLSKLNSNSTEQLSLSDADESSYSLPTASFDALVENEVGEWEVTFPSSLTEQSGELHDLFIVCKFSVKATN